MSDCLQWLDAEREKGGEILPDESKRRKAIASRTRKSGTGDRKTASGASPGVARGGMVFANIVRHATTTKLAPTGAPLSLMREISFWGKNSV